MVPPAPPGSSRNSALQTRIVGIGASAGGLSALEEFLKQVPPNSGLAYVVVQHLDPTQKAMLAQLLQRSTAMPVHEARRKMRVEPDCVYVITPNTELTVVNGALNLDKPAEPRGMRLPVNALFSSLASAQGERAIGVVLSGMGADGTLGLQAIKAVGGLTAAQQPDTAQFDSMPKAAIAARCAEVVAPPAELPARILAYVAQTPDVGSSTEDSLEDTPASEPLHDILTSLQQRTRHDFSLYKPSTLQRRIARRMAIHDLATPGLYAQFLRQNPQEIDLLFKELLIGVTSFFRDPAVWNHLAEHVLPELLAQRNGDQKLRAWVIGCSTGEEAYSLAMIFAELAQRIPNVQIFASDLSSDAIATARRGHYPASVASQLTPARLARFFSAHEGYYRIKKEIRDLVLFAQHDIVLDPPFTRLDLILCRNLLIYFDATLQGRLVPLFHYSLRPGGVLVLGSAETVGKFQRLFAPLDAKLRIYLRQDNPTGNAAFLTRSFPPLSTAKKEFQLSPPHTNTETADTLQAAVDKVLLQVYAPAAVVVNESGDIVYISGHTGSYLEPAAGKANWNFHAMAREGLRAPIAEALVRVASQREVQQLRGLRIQTSGGPHVVDVTVQPFLGTPALKDMTLIVFRDVAAGSATRSRHKSSAALEAPDAAELQRLRDEIHTLREESQASKEQLQSANEELQSTNEELQSTNEELTTSKEEMQSMNEELQTINNELQSKLDDLALAQSDLKNLLNSTEIAILFLDEHLNVRRYTDRASKIINVRESDVGRPLSDLTMSLKYPGLQEDAIETLRTLTFSEKQVPTDDGRWFTVRIMPYRRVDNMIDGIVITFVDITATKNLELALRSGHQPQGNNR